MNVIVYTLPTCRWCNVLKDFLNRHHVEYDEVNLAHDLGEVEKLYELTNQMSVPVIKINGEFLIGFNEKKLRAALHI